MYQITVSVDSANADWLYSVDDIIGNRLKNCIAVSALNMSGRRLYCSFGCEAHMRSQMIAAVKDYIIEIFGVACKFDYIKRNLTLDLPKLNYEVLLHTLVAFDRENEHKMLNKIIHVEDGMTLDGVYNFKLGELKERWKEICDLTRSNGAYLYDDETYNELLRFLISAINPKINKLTICEKDGKYRLTGSLKNRSLDIFVGSGAELMYYVIDLAPLELVIDGIITNSELYKKLDGIFDVKTLPHIQKQTKK